MLKTAYLPSPRHRTQDHSLNERDILNAIDLCPQIIKEDKLFIRNKIKDIYKQYQSVEVTLPEDYVELLQIFNDCTKPLNKIHLFDAHWHGLQVKLRKYVTNQKKKYKEQCLIQFKRQKCQQKNKKFKMMEKRIKNDDTHSRYSRESRKKDTKTSIHQSEFKMNQSQEHKRSHSPNLFQETKRFNNTSRNRCLSGNMSPSYQSFRHFLAPQSCKNNNVSYENFDWNRPTMLQSKANAQKLNNKNTKTKASKIKSNLQHKQNKIKERSKFPLGQSYKKLVDQKNKWKNIRQKPETNHQKQSIQKKQQDLNLDNYEPYKNSKNGFTVESISSIKKQRQSKSYRNNLNPVSSFSDQDNQCIFTSPELLEECRKFIKITQSQVKNITSQTSYTNSGIKSGMNIFERIDYTNFESPHFSKPKIERFQDPKQMLKHIFQKNWNVYMPAAEKQSIIQRCPQGYEQIVPMLIDELQRNNNFLNFLQVYPLIKKHLHINFMFSNIFLLLDVDSKGSIEPSDYSTFMSNFLNCQIEPTILAQLETKLTNFEKVLSQTFKRAEIIPGCFEYLQLMDKKQIYELGEVLQMFEFEIDSRSNTETYDQSQ